MIDLEIKPPDEKTKKTVRTPARVNMDQVKKVMMGEGKKMSSLPRMILPYFKMPVEVANA